MSEPQWNVEPGKSWWGSKDMIERWVTPIATNVLGLVPTSRKRAEVRTVTGNVSDHALIAVKAYACDYAFPPTDPTYDERLNVARRVAARCKAPAWMPDVYQSFVVHSIDGKRFRVQVLFGALIDHEDHVHVGVKRL